MDATRLEELGKAMYGPWWHSSLAVALGKSSRSVRFWVSGARPISDDEAHRIEDLACKRLEVLRNAIQG